MLQRYRAKIIPLFEGHRQPEKSSWEYTHAESPAQALHNLGIRYPYPNYVVEEPMIDPGKRQNTGIHIEVGHSSNPPKYPEIIVDLSKVKDQWDIEGKVHGQMKSKFFDKKIRQEFTAALQRCSTWEALIAETKKWVTVTEEGVCRGCNRPVSECEKGSLPLAQV